MAACWAEMKRVLARNKGFKGCIIDFEFGFKIDLVQSKVF
jgi:hypothetical protein